MASDSSSNVTKCDSAPAVTAEEQHFAVMEEGHKLTGDYIREHFVDEDDDQPAATAGTEPIRDELSHLTERLMNWLSLAAPESYASRAEAFAWAARAHDLARQRTATSTSTEAT